jgi:hypothetical protein
MTAASSANKRLRARCCSCDALALSSTEVICTAPFLSTDKTVARASSTFALFSSIELFETPSMLICCVIFAPPTTFAPPVIPVAAPVDVDDDVPVAVFFPLLKGRPAPPVGAAIIGLLLLLSLSVAGCASCCSRSLGPDAPPSLPSLSGVVSKLSFSLLPCCGVTAPNKKQEATNAINNIDTSLLNFIVRFIYYIYHTQITN